jgi:hypothetical protein
VSEATAEFVIDAYHRLFQIEKSFRRSNHDLQARPIYHHKRDSIEAHLTIVFAALAVSRWIKDRTGWSIKKFVRTARGYRTIEIQAGPTHEPDTVFVANDRMSRARPGLPKPQVAVGPGQVLLRNRGPGSRRIRKPGVSTANQRTATLPGRLRSGCRRHQVGGIKDGTQAVPGGPRSRSGF